MSDTADNKTENLKGGHPPAVKVGNRRVPRSRNSSNNDKLSSEELARQAAEYGSEMIVATSAVISGALVKEEKAYPPEAVKKYHDKPMPSQNKPHNPINHHHIIQQPRK